jgi:uncharacterized coiled-coil protein SlyX
MSDQDFDRRLSKLEESNETIEGSLSSLNTTIALLNQTVEAMAKREEKRQTFYDRVMLFVVGVVVSAVGTWVIKGGLEL